MTKKPSFKLSQGFDLIPPKDRKAYPILCKEWEYLKKKVSSISEKPNLYYSVGLILLGACLATFINILTGSYSNPDDQVKLVIAWAVVVVTLLVGLACLHFSKGQREVNLMKASDVLEQMDLIEERYEESNGSILLWEETTEE